jgi:hypothetical protein
LKDVLVAIIGTIATIIAAIVVWLLNEKDKRTYEDYKHREARYAKLLNSLKGFYSGSFDAEEITEFVNQLNLCWMYCPDNVIKKAYAFLSLLESGAGKAEVEHAIGDFILSIRKDILSGKSTKHTSLTAGDFKHIETNALLEVLRKRSENSSSE